MGLAGRWIASVLAGLLMPSSVVAWEITAAEFTDPTDRYPHGVLGDDLEWSGLRLEVTRGDEKRLWALDFGTDLVFEDLVPRLWDITGDGLPEVVVVQSHQTLGARLVIIGLEGPSPVELAATPHIGTRFRWLAPIAAADLDGDGHIEIAFVDRPHLVKMLRVWRYADGRFSEIANLPGLSNHRIGDAVIPGGLRDCGGDLELITADADWQSIMATRLDPETGALVSRWVAPLRDVSDLGRETECR